MLLTGDRTISHSHEPRNVFLSIWLYLPPSSFFYYALVDWPFYSQKAKFLSSSVLSFWNILHPGLHFFSSIRLSSNPTDSERVFPKHSSLTLAEVAYSLVSFTVTSLLIFNRTLSIMWSDLCNHFVFCLLHWNVGPLR